MKYLGGGHQYTPMMACVTYMVAIDTGNGQQWDANNVVMPYVTYTFVCVPHVSNYGNFFYTGCVLVRMMLFIVGKPS